MKKKQKLKERICALVLALAMVLTWVLPDAGMTVQAAGGTEVEYTVSVTDEDGALADVSVSAQTGDTAAVTAKTGQNGKATLTLTKDAEYTVTLAKEGYETHTANVTPTEQNTQMNQKLRFKPFTITASDSTIAGQNVTLQIANPVAGVSYQWTANGASAAPTSGTGTSFNITCAAAGTVNVTAAAKGQTASKSIIVNKKTINTSDISISLDPDQGAVNKISVTVAGFPADAEGQVTLQYSYQGSTYTKTASKTKDITSVVIVLNAEQDVFFGKLNCTVSYANDALYNDFSGVNKDAVYRKTHELTSEQKIELDTDNDGKKEEVYGQEITYGECIDKTVELKAEDVKDRVVTYSFDENDTESQNIVTISEDGKISLKEDGHSGTAKVIVKAAETDDYAAAQMEYYIVAKPKAITVDVSKNLTVKDASKVYDGSADITVGAVVDGTLLVNGDDGTNAEKDVLEIEGVKGTLWNTTEDDADPSTVSNEVKITADSFKEAELSSKWYEITYKGENVFEGKTTVTRRTLYFGTSDIADCNYELDMFNEIQSAQAKVVTLNKDADVKDNGFVSGENAENTGIEIPHVTVELNKVTYDEVDGKILIAVTEENAPYKDAIVPNITTENAGLNYRYEVIPAGNAMYPDNIGDLTVKQQSKVEKDILDALEITAVLPNGEPTPASDRLYYQAGADELWTNGSEVGTKLIFKIKESSEMSKLYDQVKVYVKSTDLIGKDGSDGVTFKEDTDKNINVKINLKKASRPWTKTEKIDFTVHVDSTDPRFTFGQWGETKVASDTLRQVISFNQYKKSYYSFENVSASDVPQAVLASENAYSGVKASAYYVWKLDGPQASDVGFDEVNAKIEAITLDQWVSLGEEEKSIPVIKAESGELKNLQGEYIVLAKVSDNVGHTCVYASNGVIVDVEEPSISITGVDSSQYYNADVPFTVDVEDGKILNEETGKEDTVTTSSIERVTVQTYCEGKETYKEEYPVENENADDKKSGYTLEQIKKMAHKTISEKVKASNNNSNDVLIKVTAQDRAGNKFAASQAVKIDTTVPEITVSYNNNDVKNDKYFSAGRVMTIEYKERNFDENKATFNLKVGDQTMEGVTLTELINTGESRYGIKCEFESDSEEDTEDTKRTDGRIVTYKLTFSKDNDYKVVPSYKDKADNENAEVKYEEGTKAGQEFTIDKTEPEISVKYYINGSETSVSAEEANRLYTQENVKAVVSIKEHNFIIRDKFSNDPKQMTFTVTATEELEGEAVDTEAYVTDANNQGDKKWQPAGVDIYEKEFEFTKDANYSLTIEYKDLAGNNVTYAPHFFTVDDTVPEGKVAYTTNSGEETWWNKFFDLITFNRFSNKDVPVSFESKDTTAGVATQEYYKAYEPMSKDEVKGLSDDEWTAGDGFTVEPDEQFVSYLKVTDKAGNVDYFSSEFAVVADQTKPEIEITNLSTPRNGIFKGDVKLHIEVTDPENNKTYSGLEEVWYDVKASGNVVKEVRYPSLVDNSANPVKGNQSWSGDITIPAAEYNSNDVKVQVHARDFSGNVYDSEIVPLKIDITHPTIAVTYDLNTPLNERYYKDVRTATVVVIERNFDESAVRFNITNTDGTQPAISGWTHSANAGVSDDATHTCQVTFAADGDYTFTLETTDLAGNASSYNRVDDFTIDRTVPTIQVSYDNNSAATPGYFNANRTATVTVNEHNFNAAEVNAQITAALQGSGVAAPGLGGWSTNGDVHTASVTFSADADYTFDVDYTDLAGNAAADYTQDKFTVDKTDPEVEFFDIEDKSANNGTVAPGVKYSDVNYMESGVDITIKGAKHDKTELSGNRTNIANGESIKMEDFKHDEETDDVYTMTAVIKDKAGNETEKEVMFSVNRFGSNYIFSETTEKFLDDVYANKPKDLVVTEVNVDSLVFNGISYGLDGTKKELKAGSDYTVKQSGGEGSWKEYTYTIKKENFEKEGRYSVTIDSEDKATNKMNNKVKECNIDFVIDKTPPTVVITGIEESSYRADEREMTINLSDNTAVKCVDVIIDGKSVATYAQKEIEKAGGKISYMIEGASEPQKIEAAALDMAGNETTSEMHKVLVTSSVWIQYINNTPLLIGSILGIVLVAGGLIWFFVIRKKKEESK